jgi:hypothetical protein
MPNTLIPAHDQELGIHGFYWASMKSRGHLWGTRIHAQYLIAAHHKDRASMDPATAQRIARNAPRHDPPRDHTRRFLASPDGGRTCGCLLRRVHC